MLVRAAQWLRERRLELAALEVRETAKPWREADADVCEAIDFLEYYARAAVALEEHPAGVPGSPALELIQPPGERNSLRWTPRGVVAVISPWNFPVAIPLGMVSAGLATGNAVILKPAEQAPGCALAVIRALRESGVPADALALLPGEGPVGAQLVGDPRVHTIAFTGSGPVGLEIVRRAAEMAPGQNHLKRVVAEMGGKNCVIVDSDADLDDVVPALVKSAFNYAGQKCSAAARVLAHEAIHDALVERLAGAIEVLHVGQASDPEIDVPPVIEREAQERVNRYAAEAQQRGPDRRPGARGARPRLVRHADARRRPARGLAGAQRGDLRPAAGRRAREGRRGGVRPRRRVAVRAHRRAVLAQPSYRGLRGRALARRQPVRQPRDHRRDGRPPAVRRQPAVRHRDEGGRPRLPAAVRRAARGDGEHRAPRAGRMNGVLAAALTPMRDDLSVDRAAFAAHCRRLLDDGCHALGIFGTTGEANSLSIEERIEAWEALVEDGIPAETLLPGTGACALPDAVRLSRAALELGAPGVLALPPFYYKGVTDDGLFRFFAELIERIGDAGCGCSSTTCPRRR